MANDLSVTTGSDTDASKTQNPQTAVGANNQAAKSGDVQPGTAQNLLVNSQASDGIPLTNTPLSVVNLATGTRADAQTNVVPAAPHHMNPALLIFSVVLFVVAIGMFYATSRSAKNTTK